MPASKYFSDRQLKWLRGHELAYSKKTGCWKLLQGESGATDDHDLTNWVTELWGEFRCEFKVEHTAKGKDRFGQWFYRRKLMQKREYGRGGNTSGNATHTVTLKRATENAAGSPSLQKEPMNEQAHQNQHEDLVRDKASLTNECGTKLELPDTELPAPKESQFYDVKKPLEPVSALFLYAYRDQNGVIQHKITQYDAESRVSGFAKFDSDFYKILQRKWGDYVDGHLSERKKSESNSRLPATEQDDQTVHKNLFLSIATTAAATATKVKVSATVIDNTRTAIPTSMSNATAAERYPSTNEFETSTDLHDLGCGGRLASLASLDSGTKLLKNSGTMNIIPPTVTARDLEAAYTMLSLSNASTGTAKIEKAPAKVSGSHSESLINSKPKEELEVAYSILSLSATASSQRKITPTPEKNNNVTKTTRDSHVTGTDISPSSASKPAVIKTDNRKPRSDEQQAFFESVVPGSDSSLKECMQNNSSSATDLELLKMFQMLRL